MTKIIAVIVTYKPEMLHLKDLILNITSQVDELLIIDNCSPDFNKDGLAPHSNIKWIINDTNLGLATAYNQAIKFSQERAATHLILFDQDSFPATNMISCLLKTITSYNHDFLKVAAVGPKYRDIKGQSLSPFVRIAGFKLARVACADNAVVEIDHLISSGKLIDLRAIDIVGHFTDELFIDYVDTEWCLRARHKKLLLLGVGNASMNHSIGESFFRIFNRQIPIHSPTRLYYQFRNQIWLMKQSWVGWRWRIIELIRMLKLLLAFGIFAPEKTKNIPYILKGVRDGILSHMGKSAHIQS